jgi:hypothetical protein
MQRPQLEPQPSYESAAMVAQDLNARIRELLQAQPAPDAKITWGHVGTMTEAANRLAAVVALLDGTAT